MIGSHKIRHQRVGGMFFARVCKIARFRIVKGVEYSADIAYAAKLVHINKMKKILDLALLAGMVNDPVYFHI